ncbi:MAG: imelysin family protein [Hyphomicrobiales bacterium]|nr:imelysin family protein [Hyphomicrobiales bacterium]
MFRTTMRLGFLLAGFVAALAGGAAQADVKTKDALKTYADIAEAAYGDALKTAETLRSAVAALIAAPSQDSLNAARQAWLAARAPYMQTEVYRFGNSIVDDWEGRVNAWPLDEGLIDYVDAGYGAESDENELYVANVVANPSFKLGGKTVDASKITKSLLQDTLQEAGGVEANVATGYHAIEFLLWGQDLNGTGPGSGNRPATDFDPKNCTGGNCGRRTEYLRVATDLLIDDLKFMVAQWGSKGKARAAVMKPGNAGLVAIFTGLGSLSYGELAGERMKLGLMIHDPEEEHDCFSDNTHNSHYYNILGMQNVYLGKYRRVDGATVAGPSPYDLVRAKSPEAADQLLARINDTLAAAAAMKKRAEGGEAYDQMIGEGNAEGNAVVQTVIDSLTTQTRAIERAIAALELKAIEFEGSDSLDNPAKVLEENRG